MIHCYISPYSWKGFKVTGAYKDFTAKFCERVAEAQFLTFQSLLHHELWLCPDHPAESPGTPCVTGNSSLFDLAVGSKSDCSFLLCNFFFLKFLKKGIRNLYLENFLIEMFLRQLSSPFPPVLLARPVSVCLLSCSILQSASLP